MPVLAGGGALGTWTAVLLPLICDHVVQSLCRSVSHPIYICAELVMCLYSQKMLKGSLMPCSARHNQYQQNQELTPSLLRHQENRSSCLSCHDPGAVQRPLHDGKHME